MALRHGAPPASSRWRSAAAPRPSSSRWRSAAAPRPASSRWLFATAPRPSSSRWRSAAAPRPAPSRWRSAAAPRPAPALASSSTSAPGQSSSAARSEVTSQRRSCQLSLHDGSLPQCPLLAASAGCPYQQLRHGAPASNKPHQAEKNTPVWLAIWRIWAGFANSQHRDAAFATPGNICAHSSLLPH